MRRITHVRNLILFLAALPLFAAGTVTGTLTKLADTDTYVIEVSVTADASDGSVPAYNLPRSGPSIASTDGYSIVAVETDPGSTAPTDNWDLTITTAAGLDIMNSQCLNRDTANTERCSADPVPLNGVTTLNISGNSVNSATITVKIYLVKQTVARNGGTGGGGSGTVSGSGTGGKLTAWTDSTTVGDATVGTGITVSGGEIAVDDSVVGFKFTSPSTDPGSTACLTGDYWVREDTDETWDCTDTTPTWTKRAKATHTHAASDVTSGTLGVSRGGTNLTAANDDEVMVGNGTTWQSKALPSCSNATTSKLLYDTSTNTISCGTDQTGGSSVDNRANPTQFDDFMYGSTSAGGVGKLGWSFSGGTATYLAAEAGHPGILQRNTTTTSGTVSGTSAPGNSGTSFNPSDTFDITWIARLSTVDANTTARLGAICTSSGSTTTAQPTDGLYFESAAGGNWYYVARAGGNESGTTTDTTVAANASNWVVFRIRRTDASTIGFTINGGTEQTYTTHIPTSGCNPWAMVTNSTTANKTLDLDYFSFSITGLTR